MKKILYCKGNVVSINVNAVSKRFERVLFSDITFSISTGHSLAIVGPNGSGKSTLLKILAHIVFPDKGSVDYCHNGTAVVQNKMIHYYGIVAPYVNPYRSLTALENIEFALGNIDDRAYDMLNRMGLHEHKDKPLYCYSTGMIQRMKIVLALLKEPYILFLDEPGSNLDSSGRELLFSTISEMKSNILLVIATNDTKEASLCDRSIALVT